MYSSYRHSVRECFKKFIEDKILSQDFSSTKKIEMQA